MMLTVGAPAPTTTAVSLRCPTAGRQPVAPSAAGPRRFRAAGRVKAVDSDGQFTTFSKEVTEIESAEDFDAILKNSGDQFVVLNAGASWCGPCKLFRPAFDDIAVEYTKSHNVRFLYCVGDKNPSNTTIMKKLGIKSVPSFHLFKNGEQVAQWGGANKNNFVDKLKQHL